MSHVSQGNLQSMAFALATFGKPEEDGPARVVQIMKETPSVNSVDTLIANAGIVLEDSARLAVTIWNFSGSTYRHLLVCGYHSKKRVAEMFDQNIVCDYFGIEKREGVLSQGLAAHTGAQASWVAKQMKSAQSKGAVLIAPAFHLPRKYLTVLEALRREYGAQDFAPVPVVPQICPRNIEEKSLLDVALEKESGGESDDKHAFRTLSELDAVHGEHARIIAYQQQKADGSPGDCLTTRRLELYRDWMLANHSN